jgi:ribosome-interacting GTPase 1
MPANLPPQYYELEREFSKETDIHEKLRLAKELLAIMPKHKGTDKLQAELKAKIAKLKNQIESGARKHGAHKVDPHSHIEKEGAGQVIIIGPPNSGKSSLMASLTHARPAIADYPFTTHEPLAGMMVYESAGSRGTVQIQLIDTPPISSDQIPPYLPNLIRQADLAAVVCDISETNAAYEIESVLRRLEERGIILTHALPENIESPRFTYKKTLIVAHKYLDGDWETALRQVQDKYAGFKIVPTSIIDDESLNRFRATVFDMLSIIRVYTKRVGHEPDFADPIILPIGGTVEEAARMLHKDFAEKFQFAKIWGKGKFEGQRVKNTFVLSDGDIVEFHI